MNIEEKERYREHLKIIRKFYSIYWSSKVATPKGDPTLNVHDFISLIVQEPVAMLLSHGKK